jgi:hypothetical protein
MKGARSHGRPGSPLAAALEALILDEEIDELDHALLIFRRKGLDADCLLDVVAIGADLLDIARSGLGWGSGLSLMADVRLRRFLWCERVLASAAELHGARQKEGGSAHISKRLLRSTERQDRRSSRAEGFVTTARSKRRVPLGRWLGGG